MISLVRFITSTLSRKSIFFLSISLLGIFALITVMNVFIQTRLIFARQTNNALRVKQLVLSAIRYPMLNGDQDVIQKQFDEYAKGLPGVLRIDLADARDIIKRSTDLTALDRALAQDPSHSGELLGSQEFMGVVNAGGREVFSVNVPIKNEPKCFSCHGAALPTLGTLHMHLDWNLVSSAMRVNRDSNILVSILGVFLISVLTFVFLYRTILQPLKRLQTGMFTVAQGNYDARLESAGRDEISALTMMFNKMNKELGERVKKEQRLLLDAEERERSLHGLNNELQREAAERGRVQRELVESERKFRTLVGNLNVGVYRKIPRDGGAFVELNMALAKILGYGSVDELKNVRVSDLYADPKDRDQMLELVRIEGTVSDFEMRLRKKNGELVWASMNMRAHYDEKGQILWIDAMLEDISGRKLAEERLRTAHRQLADIIEFLPDAAFVIDKEHRVISWNRAMEEMSGLKKQDILGKCGYKHAEPFLGSAQPLLIDFLVDGKDPGPLYENLTVEKNITRAEKHSPFMYGGKGAQVAINASLLYNAEGALVGGIETVRDITERVEFLRKIELSAREWRTTFDCIPDAVVLLNMAKEVKRCNRAFAEALKTSPQQLIGTTFSQGSFTDTVSRMHDYAVARGTPTTMEWFDVDSGKDIELTSAPIRDAGGVVTGVVHVSKDISARKDIEKQQRLTQLGKLVADMAHEVNNPLMIISGNAQLSLMEDIQNQEVRNNLGIIIDEARRAKDIIQRLLKFSRPSQGEFHETEITRIIDTVVTLVEHQFSLVNVTIRREYGGGLPLASVDEKQMQEVFLNLLNNAKEAMTDGGTITVRCFHEAGWIRIEFHDTGKGMSDEVLKRVMEPFFTTKANGTGLGLSVTFGIMKAHGGEIRFESAVDKGTAVVLRLPLKGESRGA